MDQRAVDPSAHAQRLETARRIVALRMIAIAVLKGTTQDTHDVVVRLLADALSIRDLHQYRVVHLIEAPRTDRRPPGRVDRTAIARERGIGQIELCKSCCTVREVRIEYIVAPLTGEGARQTVLVAIRRKFFVERERAGCDSSFDARQPCPGALEIQFSRRC